MHIWPCFFCGVVIVVVVVVGGDEGENEWGGMK